MQGTMSLKKYIHINCVQNNRLFLQKQYGQMRHDAGKKYATFT